MTPFEAWKKKHEHIECPACACIVRDCTCGYPYMEILWEDAKAIALGIADNLLSKGTTNEPRQT
jgi:hypothetical protein